MFTILPGVPSPTQAPAEVTELWQPQRKHRRGLPICLARATLGYKFNTFLLDENPSVVTLSLFTLVTQCQWWGTLRRKEGRVHP